MIDPKDMPRVPHATENGLQEGRPHPALRRYQADYKVVDWAEGLKLMAARRAGTAPRIKGGVDDDSPEMELKGAVLPDPYAKMRINPREPVPGATPRKPVKNVEENAPSPRVPSREELLRMKPGSVESMPDSRLDPFTPSSEEVEIPPNAVMPGRNDQIVPSRPSFAPAQPAPQSPVVVSDGYRERYEELRKEVDDILGYVQQRMRAEIALDSMTFSVSVVDVIESMYGVVILMPMTGDSLTFTPAPLSHARISCQRKGISADVAYTGTSFELEPLGLLGLAFMKRRDSRPEPEPERPKVVGESMSGLVARLSSAD